MPTTPDYERLLHEGREIHDGIDAGRPGHGIGYWPMFAFAQLLRVRYRITVEGRQDVAPGAAILVGNHLSMTDPVITGLANRWRLAFFTKIEAYTGVTGYALRMVGQIPLRRGDQASTRWALEMSHGVLMEGRKLGIYPEGTRSPDKVSLHRLHRRVLVPILEANPGVPVHAMAIEYGRPRWGRVPVHLRFSPPLDLDPGRMSANDLTDTVRDALVGIGGMPYVPAFAQSVKSRRGAP